MPAILKLVKSILSFRTFSGGIDLGLSLPSPVKGVRAPNLSRSLTQQTFDEVRALPINFMKLMLNELLSLNRCKLTAKKRMAINTQVLELFYPLALEQIKKLSQGGGVPDPAPRQQLLDLIADVSQVLMVSFLLLFSNRFSIRSMNNPRARAEICIYALRVLELLALKQHSRWQRYQLLDERDWQVANTVFHLIYSGIDVNEVHSTLDKELNVGNKREGISLPGLFAVLLIPNVFDMHSWPTHLQGYVEEYVLDNLGCISVNDGVNQQLPRRFALLTYFRDSIGVRRNKIINEQNPPLVFDWRPLADMMRTDCLSLIRARKEGTATSKIKNFFRLPEIEKQVVAELLVRGLQDVDLVRQMEQEQKACDLRIYVGFAEVFRLLQNSLFGRSAERFADKLAKRSALFAEDHIATVDSVWFLLYQDDKNMRLRTQETEFTTAMAVGAPLAFGFGDEVLKKPHLAVVSRIYRPSAKVVIIDLVKMTDRLEPVAVVLNDSGFEASPSNGAFAALLICDKQNNWGLLFQPVGILLRVKNLIIKRGSKEIPAVLGNTKAVTTSYYLFAIEADTEPFDF